MQLWKAICLAALAATFIGCKSSTTSSSSGSPGSGSTESSKPAVGDNSLVGTFNVEFKMPAGKENDPGAQMAKQFLKDTKLELKADHTFVLTAMGLPTEGKWKVEGDQLVTTAEKVMGMTVDDMKKMAAAQGKPEDGAKMDEAMKPMKYTISDNGNTLAPETKPGNEDKGTVLFKKVK